MATEQPRPNDPTVLVCGNCANRWGADAWRNDCPHGAKIRHRAAATEATASPSPTPSAAQLAEAYPELRTVVARICVACIRGEGEECHTPGCILWLHKVDIPIIEELLEDADAYATARVQAERAAHEAEIAALQTEVSRLENIVRMRAAERAAHEAEMARLMARLDDWKADNKALCEENARFAAERAAFAAEIAEAREDAEELNRALAVEAEAVATQRETIARLTAERTAWQAQLREALGPVVELAAKATPGPWSACVFPDAEHRFPHLHLEAIDPKSCGKERGLPTYIVFNESASIDQCRADALLTAAMKRALPRLTALLAAEEA